MVGKRVVARTLLFSVSVNISDMIEKLTNTEINSALSGFKLV